MNVRTKCAMRTYSEKPNWHEKVLLDLGYLDKKTVNRIEPGKFFPKVLDGGCMLYRIAD